MKRLLVVLVLVTMMMSTALAEVIDLKAMSTDDLIQLRQKITAEITERTIDPGNLIHAGVYIVGKDIKAGKYYLQMLPDTSGDVAILDGEKYKEAVEGKMANVNGDEGIFFRAYLSSGEQAYLSLEDGQVLLVRETGMLSIASPSWAP